MNGICACYVGWASIDLSWRGRAKIKPPPTRSVPRKCRDAEGYTVIYCRIFAKMKGEARFRTPRFGASVVEDPDYAPILKQVVAGLCLFGVQRRPFGLLDDVIISLFEGQVRVFRR